MISIYPYIEKNEVCLVLGVFLDSETNGLDWTTHVILEISFIIKNLITGEKITSYSSLIKPSDDQWACSNPESLEFTGISKESLEKFGKERLFVKKEILEIFKKNNISRGNAVFICQNPSFDRVFFSGIIDVVTQERFNLPYYWLDLASMYWSRRILEGTKMENLFISKDAIARYYGLAEEAKPHRAEAGVNHLVTCYRAVVGFPGKDSPKCV